MGERRRRGDRQLNVWERSRYGEQKIDSKRFMTLKKL